jgi:hypothetical protein
MVKGVTRAVDQGKGALEQQVRLIATASGSPWQLPPLTRGIPEIRKEERIRLLRQMYGLF